MRMSRAPNPVWVGFSTSFASRIAPAQVPKVGFCFTNCLSFSNPGPPRSLRNVPLSPPGMTRPSMVSSCSGFLTSTTLAPSSSSRRRWASKSPCKARTPIFNLKAFHHGKDGAVPRNYFILMDALAAACIPRAHARLPEGPRRQAMASARQAAGGEISTSNRRGKKGQWHICCTNRGPPWPNRRKSQARNRAAQSVCRPILSKKARQVRATPFKLANGILGNRPGHGHQQSDGDSQGHFEESVGGDNPRRAIMRDQNNDAERDGGKAIGGAETKDRTKDSAEKYAGTVRDPIPARITGDECADNRPDSGSREALPGESERIDGR